MPSKVAIDPEEPSLGCIRADSVAPPHSPASIKRCISRVERTPALVHAKLFADISCDAPLKEGYISVLRTDCPGLSPNEPMAIVESSPISDGNYVIKNRASSIFWYTGHSPIQTVHFGNVTLEQAKDISNKHIQVSRILQLFRCSKDKSINIYRSGKSQIVLIVTSPWHHRMLHPRGLVPTLLGLRCQFRGDWSQQMATITSESDSTTFAGEVIQRHLSYYLFSLTTDMNSVSQNTQVPAVQQGNTKTGQGVRFHYCLLWLSVNSLSSPVNGYSEGRWPMANVGVHSYMSTKRVFVSCASVRIVFVLTCKLEDIIAGWHLLLLYSMVL